MNPILVVGGTGNIGREVITQLTAAGAHFRALVRNPDAAHFPPQCEVMRGDLTCPETLDSCLAGIDTVFLVWTAPPAAVAGAMARFARHARRMVFLSAPLKTPHPFFQQPNSSRALAEELERTIETSGLEWTFLRPGMFAPNALRWWAADSRGRSRALALALRSDGPNSRARHRRGSRSARRVRIPTQERNMS